MAASGGNIEWSTTVKPILTALYGPFFDKNDAVEIIQAIIKSENEFQNHEDTYDLFYTCFACLSAHFISINANNLPADQLSTAQDAFRIILQQILKKLSEAGLSQDDTSNTAAPNVSVKQLLLPIVGLCGIDGGGYPPSDLVILTSLLKNAKLPAHVNVTENQTTKSSVIPSPITSLASQTSSSEKQQPTTAQRRSDALLEQLTIPLRSQMSSMTSPAQPVGAMTPGSKDSVESAKDGSSQQAVIDMKKWVASTCASLLMELRAGSVVLKVCSSLPCLQRYLNRWQTAKESNLAPQFNSDASLLHFLVNEVHVCRLALSLPCLEPFTSDRIATLSDVSTAWLLCATAQATLHQKDEESEQQTATLVESALSLYNTVGETFKQSTRAGGYVYQNHLMIGAWVLVCGLHHALGGAPGPTPPGKSPAKTASRPYNLTKMQQGLGVVWVALGGRCLAWAGALLADARLEALSAPSDSAPAPAPLDILSHHTAHHRELRIASAAPLHQLLVALGVVCYRKATNLKRAVVQKNQDADPDRSDSTVYFQDMILCSEDSETDDEDSEPLLGLWFESTLVAPDANDNGFTRLGAAEISEKPDNTRSQQGIVPDKAEPYSYIALATEVFTLLTEEMISGGAERLGGAALHLHDAHHALLAALARDLDRETARTDTGTISPCFGARLGALYTAFSSALVRYLHNLSGSPAFAALQPSLQQQLLSTERANMTPLQVGPRVIKLCGGMVLARAAADRENSVLVMWHKLVSTLQDCALQPQPPHDHDYEGDALDHDLNVEHAQMMVYLFHSLTLMQKKSVLLMTANAIIKIVETLGINDRKRAMNLAPHQLMLTTRLMLLLEYLMKHLYDAPQTLLQQIEWNLVIAPGLAQPSFDASTSEMKTTTDSGQMKTRIYCEVPFIEETYRRLSQDETSMRPKFYALTNAKINNQENPKFDGLACNFVLGTPHKLKYPLLVDALLALLNSACVCDNPNNRSSLPALAAAHYCFQTAWRLVISMPPATPHMDKLQAGTTADLPSPLPLHALIWAPRADNKKVFNPWLKDALVKQGMYTQYAENLLTGVSASCDNIKYTAWLASETIKHLKQNLLSSGLPSLIDVISCDSALARLKVCLVDASTASEAHPFVPHLLDLLETILECCRLSATMELDNVEEAAPTESESAVSSVLFQVCGNSPAVAAVCGMGASPPELWAWLRAELPPNVATLLDMYAAPPSIAEANFSNHIIPSESAVLHLVSFHCVLMSGNPKYSIGTSLMMFAYSAAKLLEIGSSKIADSVELTRKTLDLIIPALTDGRLEFLAEPLAATLNAIVPQAVKAEEIIHEHILRTTYPVLCDHLMPTTEKTLRHIVKYWEKILDRQAGRAAYESVFVEDTDFVLGKILLSAPNARNPYTERVIKLFIKIFSGCETTEMSRGLCVGVCKFIGVADQQKLIALLGHICSYGPATSAIGTANATPTETELPTPTSSAPDAAVNPASLAMFNAIRRVLFRSDSDSPQRPENGARNEQDLPVFDAPSPAPRAQSETVQPSGNSESCSWSDGSKESGPPANGAPPAPEASSPVIDGAANNAALLTALCKHIVLHCREDVSERMLQALITVTGEGTCHPLLLQEMCRLADSHSGTLHKLLFPAALTWLGACVKNLSSPEVLEKLEEGSIENNNLGPQIESACTLLAYLGDALHAIGVVQPHTWRSVSPTWESPSDLGFDFEYTDEQQDDDDTSADDSDEDAMLQYKLCTFTVTQREFMNQHWYHCHTCKMVDGVGVCTVCARVCHRGHDVSYAKFGNFFCDCGAKPDSSCQALVKRSVTLGAGRAAGASEETPPAPSLRRRPSSPTPPAFLAPPRRPLMAHNIQGCRTYLMSYDKWEWCLKRVRKLVCALAGPVRAACERTAAVGAHGRAQRALAQLHLGEKRFSHTDALMVPTLGPIIGSQEGAFENVRMSYTGENGQTIRQLISAHKLRRVAMCCLASPQGRRQHLAVSHEKGKITVLQLSALLKQADSTKHKLTLTRLSTAPIPFTVITLSGNVANEDLLAVCGLKECHVLTFNSAGAISEHFVLTTGLEANNYIIKAIWLPGSQTQMALVTSDFIKIYDLSKDLNNPLHHFLVPSGKVRDVTFVNQEGVMHMLCMSSAGHIYWQPMSEESRATLGTFYVTNTLEVLHPEIQDVAGLVGGGGVSIYYSHTLKMLFFSYAQGKSFLAPLNSVEESVKGTAMITVYGGGGGPKEGGRGKSGAQSLVQWSEVHGHPGLITALMQASNNPVVLMLTPTNIYVQEIKFFYATLKACGTVVPAKAKITDMVAVRHWCAGGEQKSTLILLCEDGSLRMYAANPARTGYWLSPAVQPAYPPRRRARLARPAPHLAAHAHPPRKQHQAVAKTTSNGGPQFPIDFFEHCVAMGDIEFGGNDLLQVYNTAQIKHRLNTTGLYVVSTKMSGFTMDLINSDPNMVICGIRVLLGSQDAARTPTYVEIHGRAIPTMVVRNRWFDIPLTREESLLSDKKLVITFGPSQDPDGVTMVDSVKVYGKNKEQFGWPEENEDPSTCPSSSKVAQVSDGASDINKPSSVERLACSALEALELGAGAPACTGATAGAEAAADAARTLLCVPATPLLHARAQCLLRAVYQNYYHQFKDQAILRYVCASLRELRDTADTRCVDPEAYFRLVLLARSMAIARPQNLVKYTAPTPRRPANGDWSVYWKPDYQEDPEREPHVCALLLSVLWKLAACKNQAHGPPGVLSYGLRHAESTLHALADTIHAFQLNADPECFEFGNQIYLSLLLAEDQSISFGAKAALMRVLRPRVKRRRVYIPSPPNTPGAGVSTTTTAAQPASETAVSESDLSANRDEQQEPQYMDVDDSLEPMVLLAPDGGLEALLDIPADADDETMVELAIALSLQEQPRRAPAHGALAHTPTAPPPPAPGFSDANASPNGSDDEGSTAATDGSTLRTSPAEAAGSAGSESGGSGADSIGGVSGRSSAYGEMSTAHVIALPHASVMAAPVSVTAGPSTSSSQPVASTSRAVEAENETRKLHALRLSLLSAALDAMPSLRNLSGVRAIPFVQVLLMLAGDLDSSVEGDRAVLDRLLEVLVGELDIQGEETSAQEPGERRDFQLAIMRLEMLVSELDANGEEQATPIHERTNRRELQLVIMRLLSVLMARWKTCGTSEGAAREQVTGAACAAHVSRLAAAALVRAGAPRHCYAVLAALLPYWKEKTATTATTTPTQQLLKPLPPSPLPDMQPFFVKEYVKGHAIDVFDNYPQLLMEMALRLPCQIHKHCDPAHFDARWRTLLCEYMMNQQTPLRKQVRKLLLLLCGTRERYRQLRDVHALDTHLTAARALLATDPAYDKLVRLMEHLKACAEIVGARTGNWQHTCCTERRETLGWLVSVARRVHPHVAPTVLQLLQAALCAPPPAHAHKQDTKTPADWPERERSADSDAFVTDGSKFQEQKVPQLVQQILKQVPQDELKLFVKAFLLETNSTAVRWQAHALLLAIYNNSPQADQASLVSLLWGIWPTLPQYGRKAAQFVDLLGYFTLKTPNIDSENYISSAVDLLRNQNRLLSSHGNSALYAALGAYVELDGHYLESEPCLVCNNPEVPMATIKLPTIKIDSKFTTTTQIVKLVNSHMISRISLRIGDIKRSKMVRTINFYYNNRTVQAVQELKNKPGMWHKAKRVQLQSGQTEVRVDFPLPIVACNLMMEYAEFYENQQATGESLQCPRCSQSVPANPGVCANCGENVFQCHKCRAINYDEKDPFLCHACGFCKYAKFDYTLIARPCCAVDTIENDEERKKMVQTIGALLDKADRVYRQLIANKPILESLVHKISEHRVDGRPDENSNTTSATFGGAQINRVIQTLAHKYCVESKGHFEDLSKIIQKVLACRKELVAYDKAQSEQQSGETLPVYAMIMQNYDGDLTKESGGSCYGCSLATAEHCLTLLRALASQRAHRGTLCNAGLVHELVHHNLHRGTPQSQEEVRSLICLVTRDNLPATEQLCKLLTQRITLSLMGHAASQDHNNSVRPLVLLLGSLVKVQDSVECWEARLRCIVKLWVWCCPQVTEVAGIPPAANAILKDEALADIPGINTSSPNSHQFALQQVALPLLRYMQELMAPTPVTPPAVASTASNDEQPKETEEPTEQPPVVLAEQTGHLVVELAAWLAGRVPRSEWRRLAARPPRPPAHSALPPRDLHLAHKCIGKWRERVLLSHGMRRVSLDEGGWLRPVMFDPSSRIARDTACQMVKSLCDSYERTKAVLILLTSFLPEVGAVGEASEQFLQLYQSLASEAPWKQFLAMRGVLQQIADLMTKEIDQLHRLEETTLTSDLAQGYALKRLTELLAMFLEEGGARRAYKGRLVGAVLGGYLSLRRLVVQRTRLTDDTQEKLLELLEEMTTGTEAETAEFMAVCIETVQKYPLHDYRTPVFIFERLCSIIYPEENDVGEFFLTLEKDPQQEDFLQGRMLGNPYSSHEPGMGPLMRDVKNKICTDCELVALLEDDNGMELLVCNKIMSLDLPVKDVYKKVWCTSGESVDAMRVVYRMRGLLGDATEEFVETLSQTNAEAVDDEQTYRMANVLADCGGLEVMLQRLAAIQRVGGARALVSTLLRLLSLCVRVRRCVRVLTRTNTRALPVLLHALTLSAAEEKDMPRADLVYQLLEIMERILTVAASESLESFLQFSLTFGGPEHVQALLNCTELTAIRNNSVALGHLMRVLAALVYGNDLKMAMLVDHFKPVLDFDKLDTEQWSEEEFRMELFCVLCANVERNSVGGTLKDYLISLGVVRDALEYIVKHAPCVKPTLVCTDSDELKEFISRPALKFILRFLTGLASDHEPTQMLVCEKVIPIVHRLEQVSSGEHVGSLAENLLEALRSQPQCAAKVQQVRDFTRQEKKRLAMAVRERQLGALGMRSNERGQVTAQCSLTQQVADLAEEAGAVCCICREGYKYQPTKVLGIYTFTKRCPVEEFELRARKTLGYTTVSHYNIVHVECHMAAVRLQRARDEWESAALQNASTRCNGLLPLWGPNVPESAFASCLARHTTYLQECTGHRDIGHQCTLHDLKLLLWRFARGRTFHDDTGGGGPLSNMQLVPALVHMALYVINTTRVAGRELASLEAYLGWAPPKLLESAHEAEGALYYVTLMLMMFPHAKWKSNRVEMLKRLIVTGHVRAVAAGGPQLRALSSEQRALRQWTDYKAYALMVALVDQLYMVMFKAVPANNVEQWPVKLAEYIRVSDEANAKAAERIVTTLTDELLPCASFGEICDAAGLLADIPDPDAFLQQAINELP
ncbi:E3 ubiquitin-protein ligase UBR4 isoform X1 [Colias croceus]|uniref:E3 ubiquitin-protein ligase UBR4 isoform X1 n=1 Tax=Colias crocea TaxID=72248 RepID=UPI001E27B614|nr:E3 ubiquitin-protein ligase UBR4 isoform X1 [Colias croceus]